MQNRIQLAQYCNHREDDQSIEIKGAEFAQPCVRVIHGAHAFVLSNTILCAAAPVTRVVVPIPVGH